MNPLPFILIAAVGYFAASILRTLSQEKAEPRIRFRNIVSALDTLAAARRGAQKQAGGVYLFWPKGHIGGVNYDGAIATYIQPIESTLRFDITTYAKGGNPRPSWQQAESFSCGAVEFSQRIGHVLGLSGDAKFKLINAKGQATALPTAPPR
jgi:hypothetical protein